MSECYDQKLCEKTHKIIEEQLKNHEDRLNGHSKIIDTLEQDSREYKTFVKRWMTPFQQ